MEIREYEKDLFKAYCKSRYKVNGTFDEILKTFNNVDGDWNSWEKFRDDNFILLLDTAEDATRAASVMVAKIPAYFVDINGLNKIVETFRPISYSMLGGKKIRGYNENKNSY